MSVVDSEKKITPEDISKLNEILNSLKSEEKAQEFLKPVDYKALNLHDYLNIIKNPMDLSTITNNLKNGKYNFVSHVLEDIQLIWDNCKLYNIEGSV